MVQIGNDWDSVLDGEFEKEYYLKLRAFLAQEYKTRTVYPDMYSIFNALKLTSYEDTKVVILGQDPYHGPGQAHGLAFSVQKGIAIPPSLLNMYKELKSDLSCYIPDNGFLEKWTRQGVLLLNTSLTVREASPNSHQKIGWEILTDRVIELLNQKKSPVVFLLWGANARSKASLVTNPMHTVLQAPHPSPLSASRGFFGCRHFSKANAILERNGMQPIDWQIENLNI
ncbi:MAG: uracil-DNA glycosylase [Clostridia bacterium]|nr:uracil-DNA glycosylase [Clostridia bacterium]